MQNTPYNKLIQNIHDAAETHERTNRSKKELVFFEGYAVALLDHGIITEGEYRTARDYCEVCIRRKVDHSIIPLNAC